MPTTPRTKVPLPYMASPKPGTPRSVACPVCESRRCYPCKDMRKPTVPKSMYDYHPERKALAKKDG